LSLDATAAERAKPNTSVTGVRFWSLTDVTRVVVETTDDFHFKSDRVPDPDRLFFDLSGTRLRIGNKGYQTISVGDKLLRQIRVAEKEPGTTRVVFDLEKGVEFTASQLSNPSRLIIELRPTGTAAQSAQVTMSVTGAQKLADVKPTELAPADLQLVSKPATTATTAMTVTSLVRTVDAKVTGPRALDVRTEEKLAAPMPTPPAIARTTAVVPASMGSQPVKAALPPTPLVTDPPKVAIATKKPAVPVVIPRAAKLPNEGDSSLTRVLGLKIGRIVLDAGHGGHDTGTSGPNGLTEKDLVLDVCRRLGALIQARMGSEVIYTRTDDTFIPLEERTQIANDRRADLFLSIHANSSPIRAASGVETYYLNFTTSKEALQVAARENASSQKTVFELKDLLQKIALKDKVEESREFAAKIQSALYGVSAKNNVRSKDRGVKKAPFVVLIGASMPSVLAEIGFVSNPRDEAAMKRPEVRQKIAEALYKGLSQYAGTLSQAQFARN
jgi:N-acetylmuramoyl-L-alanine amidase